MNQNVTDLRNSDFEILKRFLKLHVIKEDKIKSEKLCN